MADLILDTRPALYRARTAAAYAAINLPILHWPIQTPEPTAESWPAPEGYDAVLFTSQLAVPYAPVAWHRVPAYAVGEETAAMARAAGFAQVTCTGRTGADLEAHLRRLSVSRAFYPSATEVSRDLASIFAGTVERRAVYTMRSVEGVPSAVAAQLRGRVVIAPVFSRRSAVILARLIGDIDAVFDVVAISAAAIDPTARWRRRAVADEPTLDSMAAAIHRLAEE